MPGTFSDSWKLTKTAFGLIRQDRALLVFPVVAALGILGVLALLGVGLVLLFLPALSTGAAFSNVDVALGAILFVAAYVAMVFVSVYCTAALIGAATLKLNGQQPTAADGWRVARARIGRLLLWALIAATVGLVIQIIASRVRGIAGMVIAGVGGASWAVATYFVIPVLLYESEGAWRSLVRSARLFVSTFGRSIVSNLVVGLLIVAGVVVAIVLIIVGFTLFSTSVYLGVGVIVAAIAVGAIVALLGATAEGILRAALYRYAMTGKIDPDLLPSGYSAPPPGPGSASAPLP